VVLVGAVRIISFPSLHYRITIHLHHQNHLHSTTSPIMFTNSLVIRTSIINHHILASSHPRIITSSSHHPIATSSHRHIINHHIITSSHQPITQSSDRFRGKQNTNDEKEKNFPAKDRSL